MTRRIIRVLAVASLLMAMFAMSGPALADHDHVLLLGNGQCVILAENGQEKDVELPHAEDEGLPEGRRHPLHANVHLGEPGTRQGEPVIFVLGSPEAEEHCDGYVNG